MTNIFKCLAISVLLFFGALDTHAQDTIQIEKVEVKAARSSIGISKAARSITVISKQEIESSPARTINEVLEYALNLDVRQRGQNGVQADLSLRGSSFEQVLVLLNGIKMTDPQTGHHSLNLPIHLLDVERIEIIKGGATRIYGPGAFAGAINIITKNPNESQAKIQALTGQYGLQQLAASVTLVGKNHSHSLSVSDQQSDGFIRNTDYTQQNIFWQSEFSFNNSDWTLNLGQNSKAFGAQNFYTANFPDQFEETKTQFASLAGVIKKEKLRIEPQAYYRRHDDRFELFREDEGFYRRIAQGGFANDFGDFVSWYNGHNYTQTNVYGAELNLQYQSKLGKTSLGFDFRREEILSNGLGEPLSKRISVDGEDQSAFYLRGDDRENRSVYAEHNYVSNKVFVSIGAMYNLHTDFDDEIFPGIDASYQLSEKFRTFASANKSFRFPTYTDLYYSLGGAQGSINLKPEESINYELGFKYAGTGNLGTVSFFRREGKNLIDWIRLNGSLITQATNLTEVNINGGELEYIMQSNSFLKKVAVLNQLRFSYAYLWSDNESTGFESNYVLDFLSHKADLLAQLKLTKSLFIDCNFSFQERRGEFVRPTGEEVKFEPVFLTDIKLSVQKDNLTLFLQASNLFNQDYFDIGNVANPGRWISVGANYKLNLKKTR